jgi:hypothetical protein
MKALGRLALILVMLFAALFFYSMGMKSGAFLFILLGFLCEAGFWLGIFPLKRNKTSS